MVRKYGRKRKSKQRQFLVGRLHFLIIFFLFFGAVTIGQLLRIQVLYHYTYIAKAREQYGILKEIESQRGEIFWQDISTGETFPLAMNRTAYNFYIVPKEIDDQENGIRLLTGITGKSREELYFFVRKRTDPYELILRGITQEDRDRINSFFITQRFNERAYGFEEASVRYFSAGELTAHITGFLGFGDDGNTKRGLYGLEEYFDESLRGKNGVVLSENDAMGRPIPVGKRVVEQAQDGVDIMVTIDRNIQYKACAVLDHGVRAYGAQGGAVVIMDPRTGFILALCGEPSFDPNNYGESDQKAFVNFVVTGEYEPGSVFKPITMAAALDRGAITPWTTYHDTGFEKFGKYTIRNFDGKAHGIKTMIDVLRESLNTGAIFAMRSIGATHFQQYVNRFGFGKLSGIELAQESDGNISILDSGQEIYAATASYGQGITVTPIQLVAAYAAIARGGTLIKPTLIKTIVNGTTAQYPPSSEGQEVISKKVAQTISSMLVSVVEDGYDKKALIPGYKIAGKTGTAQVPKAESAGYGDETIHTFVGFGPVGDREPVFVLLVKLDKPTKVRFASNSTAPMFKEIAEFVLSYLEVPTEE